MKAIRIISTNTSHRKRVRPGMQKGEFIIHIFKILHFNIMFGHRGKHIHLVFFGKKWHWVDRKEKAYFNKNQQDYESR